MCIFCTPLGCHAPNVRMQSTSCYVVERKNKLLILDMGIGVKFKVINYIVSGKYSPEDITIVISHNHIDHVAGINALGEFMVKFFSHSKIKLFMSDTSQKYNDWYHKIRKKYSLVFDISVINEKKCLEFVDLQMSFCKTNHCEDKLKSFATKISHGNESFVYTSDIASIDNNLKSFIKNTDLVMVDAGNPVKRVKTLEGYHGNTRDNVCEILNSGVGNIYLTHLKACFDESDYINSLTIDSKKNVNLVKTEVAFDIFTGEKSFEYNGDMSVLMA